MKIKSKYMHNEEQLHWMLDMNMYLKHVFK